MTSSASGVRALLVGHGQFAQGLGHALGLIVGPVSDLEIVSSEGKGQADLGRIVAAARERAGGRPLLVFADVSGGFSTNLCGKLLRDCAEVGIIGGVNLPMLIKFVQQRDQMAFPALFELLVQVGQTGIKGLKAPGRSGVTS